MTTHLDLRLEVLRLLLGLLYPLRNRRLPHPVDACCCCCWWVDKGCERTCHDDGGGGGGLVGWGVSQLVITTFSFQSCRGDTKGAIECCNRSIHRSPFFGIGALSYFQHALRRFFQCWSWAAAAMQFTSSSRCISSTRPVEKCMGRICMVGPFGQRTITLNSVGRWAHQSIVRMLQITRSVNSRSRIAIWHILSIVRCHQN